MERRRGMAKNAIPLCCSGGNQLGVDATLLDGEGYAVDGEHIRGDPVIHSVRLGITNNIVEALRQNAVELIVDDGFFPKVSLAVLHPFKIGGSYSAGVRKNVGND